MDTDPLQDTVPPRYAFESDDEEDEPNPLRVPAQKPSAHADVTILGKLSKGVNLVVASGDAGTLWARGADLGEQIGAVAVNGVQVGLVFNPTWTKSTVIISEALSSLPLFAMHPYADKIIEELSPPRISMLDTYPVPTYVSDGSVPSDDAPIRYLSTLEDTTFLKHNSQLFGTPNLIQSTTAAFMSASVLRESRSTLILLPSPYIPRPRPDTVAAANVRKLDRDEVHWAPEVVNTAQDLLFRGIGETPSHPWRPLAKVPKQKSAKQQSEIGEGGMYI